MFFIACQFNWSICYLSASLTWHNGAEYIHYFNNLEDCQTVFSAIKSELSNPELKPRMVIKSVTL